MTTPEGPPSDKISIEDFYVAVEGEDYLRLALSTTQAAAVSGLSVRTLEKMRAQGRGPAYVQAGPHTKVYYLPQDILTYMASQRRLSMRLSDELVRLVPNET